MRFAALLPAISAPTRIRLGFAVITLLYAVLTNTVVATLPWLLLVLTLDLTATALGAIPGLPHRQLRSMSLIFITLSAAAAGAAFGIRGVATAPLVLIPAYHSGLRFQRRGYVVACGTALLATLGGIVLFATARTPDWGAVLAWSAAAVTLGVLGSWSHRLSVADAALEPTPDAAEAVALIQRLRTLSESMDTGFDAPARGSSALVALHRHVETDRSVVFVGAETGQLSPVAMRGATRVPWLGEGGRAPLLDTATSTSDSLVQSWSDSLGDRHVLSVPLLSQSGEHIGLIVADRSAAQPFERSEILAAQQVAAQSAPALDAAVLFGELRSRASLEERQRLARDIHDGIAQTIAALGFEIDVLRMQAAADNNELAPALARLGDSLRSTLLDVRLHISDLNMSQRPQNSLGTLLTSALQSFGSVTGMETTVSVSEGLLRLPSHVELSVYRLGMDVLADAQASGASSASVALRVESPAVRLTVAHDGATRLSASSFDTHPLRAIGATIDIRTGDRDGVEVVMQLGSVGSRSTVTVTEPESATPATDTRAAPDLTSTEAPQ
ncbi:MAG: GAF domain-containing protein [Tetrasphaera sp.]|nr:GAF domain-containing protein [Tetrasphaera sp.]